MSSKTEKGYQAYNALRKSDIFNVNPINNALKSEKPKKKAVPQSISFTTQIKLFNSNEHYIKDNSQSKGINQISSKLHSNSLSKAGPNPQDIIKPITAYDRFLREFHNAEIDLTGISNSKGYLVSELKSTQPTKHIVASSNRIDSLKSNIFNDIQKEKDNKSASTTNISNKIERNNWNTQLDWKNSQSELILKNQKTTRPVSQCQTLNDYYQSKQSQNIIRHRFMIFPANNIDREELEKEFKDKGVHIFNVEKHSDWLNGHGQHLMYFDVRDNERNAFQLQFAPVKERLEKAKGIHINFTSCDKVGIDTDTPTPQGDNGNARHKHMPQCNREHLAFTSYNRPFMGK